jgi:hypothetical protein
MNGMSDDELRARFEALRRADERYAPGLERILNRPPRPLLGAQRPRFAWRLGLVAASVAAAFLLSTGVTRMYRRYTFVAQPLSIWTSPTASLLHMPGTELLRAPKLMPSALDYLTIALVQRKGR